MTEGVLIMTRSWQTGWRWLCAAALVAGAVTMAAGAAWAQDETPAAPVVEIVFGTGVNRTTRAIEGESTSFAAGGFLPGERRIFCLTRVLNLAAPATVTHVWYHKGKTMARVELRVGSADWRTWSAKRFLPEWTGGWEVKVLDADGMVLASAGFTIE